MEKSYTVRLGLRAIDQLSDNKIQYISGDKEVYPLRIILLAYDKPFAIPEGAFVEMHFTNNNNEKYPAIAEIIDGEQGFVLYNVAQSDIAVPGQVAVSVAVTSGSERLTWVGFQFTVKSNPANGQTEPPDVLEPWMGAIVSQLSDHETRLADLAAGGGGGGANGKSAYEIAVDNGFVGTEAAWLESLRGLAGADGQDGAQGEKGDTGLQGPKGDTGESFDPADVERITALEDSVGDISTALDAIMGV